MIAFVLWYHAEDLPARLMIVVAKVLVRHQLDFSMFNDLSVFFCSGALASGCEKQPTSLAIAYGVSGTYGTPLANDSIGFLGLEV